MVTTSTLQGVPHHIYEFNFLVNSILAFFQTCSVVTPTPSNESERPAHGSNSTGLAVGAVVAVLALVMVVIIVVVLVIALQR